MSDSFKNENCYPRCIERSRRKCIQYWPENNETQEFATVDVSHEETLEFEDHVERVFWMKHKRVRDLCHI